MNSRRILELLSVLVLVASPAGAVVAGTITGGNRLTITNGGAAGVTVIAANAPLTGDGTLDTVSFGWTASGGCAAVTIKVFRVNGANVDFIGERGPIAATWNIGGDSDLTSAPLSPPLAVQKGDYLGMAPANTGDCGNVVGWTPGIGSVLAYDSDVTSTVSIASGTQREAFTLSLFASGSGDGETFAGILTGAGSLHGASGSNFKTGLQVTNPGFSTILGRLVFHPAGQSSGANDPSFGFSLDPGRTGSVDDLIAGMGLSGLWTVDVYTGAGSGTPLVIARVFNDAGAEGTTGFTEELIDPSKVQGGVGVSVTGVLVCPPDFARYRYNIGIRTIGGPVSVSVSVKDPDGNVVHSFSKNYDADSFSQISVHEFLGGFDPGNNDSLVITFSGGGAIIYGATTDNVTNDPSVQFMPYLFAIA
jgi:hypothetical protein